jgi:cell division septum initiation protein DivIVA
LSAHECTALFNKAQTTLDTHQAVALLIEAGCGFAHLGDAAATKAVNGLLTEKIKAVAPLTNLQNAQIHALRALELALAQAGAAKDALSKCIDELENFSGSERLEVEQLLADVRKSLASIRATGLKSLLNKFKF